MIPEAKRTLIAQRYSAGDPLKKIEGEFGVGRNTVRQIAAQFNLPSRRLSSDERKEIIEQYANGRLTPDIAEYFDVSASYVSKIAIDAGFRRLPLRRRH